MFYTALLRTCTLFRETNPLIKQNASLHYWKFRIRWIICLSNCLTKSTFSAALIVPLDQYYYHRMEGSSNYREEKGEYRFRCHVCSKMLYSNVKLMFHMMNHIDEALQPLLSPSGLNQCTTCYLVFPTPFALRQHTEECHQGSNTCRICEKDMGNENGLRRHMQVRSFSLPFCLMHAVREMLFFYHIHFLLLLL